MTDEEVAVLLLDPEKQAGRNFIIVDVGRTDFGVPWNHLNQLMHRTTSCEWQ